MVTVGCTVREEGGREEEGREEGGREGGREGGTEGGMEEEREREGRNQQDGRREGDHITDVQYTLRCAVILSKEFSISAKHE